MRKTVGERLGNEVEDSENVVFQDATDGSVVTEDGDDSCASHGEVIVEENFVELQCKCRRLVDGEEDSDLDPSARARPKLGISGVLQVSRKEISFQGNAFTDPLLKESLQHIRDIATREYHGVDVIDVEICRDSKMSRYMFSKFTFNDKMKPKLASANDILLELQRHVDRIKESVLSSNESMASR